MNEEQIIAALGVAVVVGIVVIWALFGLSP